MGNANEKKVKSKVKSALVEAAKKRACEENFEYDTIKIDRDGWRGLSGELSIEEINHKRYKVSVSRSVHVRIQPVLVGAVTGTLLGAFVGGGAGGLSGAGIGALAGSVVPVIGTAVGAGAGALIGTGVGGVAGGTVGGVSGAIMGKVLEGDENSLTISSEEIFSELHESYTFHSRVCATVEIEED